MSFASVLAPGRNETTLWVDPADQDKYKLAASRRNGIIVIANRGEATCRRAARLEITPQAFEAGTPPGQRSAPHGSFALGPGRRSAPARTPGPPNVGAGVVHY